METPGQTKQKVALVLSSGGPRGFAYIGAIEELESRGYEISSIAGASIGSLVGGIYAAGKMEEVKQWLFTLDAWKVFSLMDISISMNHLVKGDRIIEAIKEIVPDTDIESLRIPFKAIATDFYTGEEVIFDKGNLFQAIRASISIPSLFRPVKIGTRTLIDGGISNTMPLNRVDRTPGDILVGFDVNDVDVDGIRAIFREDAELEAQKEQEDKERSERTKAVIDAVRHNDSLTLKEKLKLAGMQGQEVVRHMFEQDDKAQPEILSEETNYFKVLGRTFNLMNHVIAKLETELNPPDILIKMPFDEFGSISDYARAEEISEQGRLLMRDALDKYEKKD